jgi:hypothetical protein
MLAALAVVALAVGSIGATMTVSQNGHETAEQVPVPVVEVQAIQSPDMMTE